MTSEDEELDFWADPDRLYDASMALFGTPVRIGVFDRTLLLPLAQLPEIVGSETDEELPLGRVGSLVSEGWIPDLRLPDSGDPGFALYAPSRVGLFVVLEREGYDAGELRALAAYEEGLIDAVLVNGDMPYLEDDRELLLLEMGDRLQEAQYELERLRDGSPFSNRGESQVISEIEGLRRSLSLLENHSLASMTTAVRERTARMAYRVRMRHEQVRLMVLEHERRMIRAGYTPYLHFSSLYYGSDDAEPPVTGKPNWELSLSQPWACEDGASIRLPGLRIKGTEMTFSPPPRPKEYARRWRELDLDGYLRVRAEVVGSRECKHCHRELPVGAPLARRYCNDTCKANAKMQSYRDRIRLRPRPGARA
jgi:hypothetical protein